MWHFVLHVNFTTTRSSIGGLDNHPTVTAMYIRPIYQIKQSQPLSQRHIAPGTKDHSIPRLAPCLFE